MLTFKQCNLKVPANELFFEQESLQCCKVTLLSLVPVIIQIIALIIYPVKFNELIYEGYYDYTWAYGFGWGATVLMLGCGILFCCLPRYEDELSGMAKTKYIYTSA